MDNLAQQIHLAWGKMKNLEGMGKLHKTPKTQ